MIHFYSLSKDSGISLMGTIKGQMTYSSLVKWTLKL